MSQTGAVKGLSVALDQKVLSRLKKRKGETKEKPQQKLKQNTECNIRKLGIFHLETSVADHPGHIVSSAILPEWKRQKLRVTLETETIVTAKIQLINRALLSVL